MPGELDRKGIINHRLRPCGRNSFRLEGQMFRFLAILIALFSFTMTTPAFAHDGPKADKAHECAGCAKAKSGENHWCGGCKKGFVDGKPVTCESCFKGKTGETIWCDSCNAGYHGSEKISCKTCYDHKANKGPACNDAACKNQAGEEG